MRYLRKRSKDRSGRFALAIILVLFLTPVILPAAGPRYPVLEAGVETRGIIRTDTENGWYRTYILDIPLTVSAFRIRILEADADLDLFLKHGSSIEDYSEVDFYSESDDWLEELNLYRIYETWMPSGRYYLDVAYQWDEPPRKDGRPQKEIPFMLELEIFDGADSKPMAAGTEINGRLDDSVGYLEVYEFEIKRDIDAFRLDILECPGDVDLYLSRNEPSPPRQNIYAFSESMAGRETLIIDSPEEDLRGRWYLSVMEAVEMDYPVEYSLLLTSGRDAPGNLPTPPVLQTAVDPLTAARQATVQLTGRDGIGSGCLVGDNGYILTNHHVVTDIAGNDLGEMIVAVSTAPFEVPVEAFLAEVVDTRPDDDLALLKIVADRWGRPLEGTPKFPGWRLGDPGSLRVGEPLLVLGYPWIGSGLSRPYFTMTRGILSGGEMTARGLLLKTDAIISGGGSGGAVTDGSWRLAGLPTFTVSEEAGQLTYFVPVDRIPRDWRERLRYE